MNKAQARALQADLAVAINKVLEAHGLEKQKQNMSFTESGEVNVTIKAATAEAKQSKVAIYAELLKLDTKKINSEFTFAGKTLKLVDYNSRARKMPWIAQDTEGKRYKLSDDQVRRAQAQF